ncbi:C25 family cysteine peptidase [Apibacter mensalis]|uniref:type IX secretion system sortase PorU n=1 Tax=Apibacter mensalis TaxID=1586267 RepID=UPI0026EE689B|nr:C25 family cysteine peptidase [Apibacter mensalis]
MKRFLYIFIAFFIQVSTFIPVAQTITINWDGIKNFYYSTEQVKKYPFFTNDNYSIDEGIPTLYYAEKTDFNGDVYLTNLQWQPIEKSQLGDTPLDFIPDDDIFSASITKSRDQKFISVTIKTLKKTGNTIFKLVRFTIEKKNSFSKNFSSTESFLNVESVLKNGSWYKIKLAKTGIYKIDRNFLQSLGINCNSLDPKTIRIFGNGGKMLPEPTSSFRYDNLKENTIFVRGENDGIFDSDDYILFYGQGPDYWIRNSKVRHKKNIYEDYAYYFINVNQTSGKRIQSNPYKTPNAKVYVEYDDHQFFEEDRLNLNQLGKIWVDENLGLKNYKEILFPVHDLVPGSSITWKYAWVSRNGINGKINVSYNDIPVYSSILRPSPNEIDFAIGSQTQTITPTNNQLKFTLGFDNSANPSAEFYPDYFEVLYKQKLKFNGSQMNFRTFDPIEDGKIYGFTFVPSEDCEVWDVSDIVNAKKLERSANAFTYSYQLLSTNFKNEMIAFKHSAAYIPEVVGKISNQALHSISDVDYIVITVPEFVSQANRIKNLHQSKNRLKVEVVTVNQIYNEFSSGGQDLTAIRDFLRYLYKKDNGKLKYVLLLGSASNVNGTIILNDFYTGGESSPCLNPNLKDYQKGKVWYRLENLETGNHSIKFKVWDINNNSSSATLDFLVVNNGDQGLIIKKLLNWPNPFTTKTFFHFEHNCPDILDVQVQIFTVSGKLVKTINKTVTSQPFNEGYRTDKFGIEWDGLDDFGDKIGKGVYIYRVKIKGTSDFCKGSVSQVEKLVILK